MYMNNKHVKFIMYAGGIFLVMLSILAIIGTVVLARGSRSMNENTISVSGTAEIDASPDIANFSFTVTETSDTAEGAQKVISEKIAMILDGLEGVDVDESDIKTQSYTIYPKYEWLRAKPENNEIIAIDGGEYYPGDDRQRVQTGFDVSQNVSVTLRDFDVVPQVLTLFAETGVDNLNGPNFQIEDPEALKQEARQEAIKKAKEQAKDLARDLDVRLGKIVSFNENNGGYYPQPYFAKSAMMADVAEEASFAPELPIGENTVSASVSITYKIK